MLAASAATAVPWATGLGGSRSSLLFLDGEGVPKELVRPTGSSIGLDMSLMPKPPKNDDDDVKIKR